MAQEISINIYQTLTLSNTLSLFFSPVLVGVGVIALAVVGYITLLHLPFACEKIEEYYA